MIDSRKRQRRLWSRWFLIFLGMVCSLVTSAGHAQPVLSVDQLLERYAEMHLSWDNDKELEQPLLQLLAEAERFRDANSTTAEAWIATARIRFGYANTLGITGFFSQSKTARNELEKAVSLDRTALNGYAQALLGLLYVGLPPWPLSFGSKKKGERFYEEALSISDSSAGNNYLYGLYLAGNKQYAEAERRLMIAKFTAENQSTDFNQQALYLREVNELLYSISER